MKFTYDTQYINAKMSLEDALKAYSDEIQILTLKDGTNIEIISNNKFLRRRPEKQERREMGYIDNQLQNIGEKYDEFIEEDITENSNNFNYQEKTPTKIPGLLRGKGKKKGLGKSLRKTVLISINGGEKEKIFENGKLKNLKSDKPNLSLNQIIHFSENNDFIQCANCHKFFPPDEEEENKQMIKTTINDQKTNHQQQQFPPSGQKFSPFPQQPQPYPQSKQNQYQNKKGHHQQGPAFPNKKQKLPQKHQQKQFIPPNQPKYPTNMNMNMGFPQKPNQPQGFYQQPFQQPFQQQIPYQNQQKGGFNQQYQFYNQKNIHGGFPIPNQQMHNQFRGNIPILRARKNDINNEYEYELENGEEIDDDFDNMNTYTNTENNYFYPASAKKYKSGKKMFEIYPKKQKINREFENRGLTRNLSYGYKKSTMQGFGYADNNPIEYMNINENEYYEYPEYYKNMIPTGRTKKTNNHRDVNVKVGRNNPYQYQDYEDYYDYQI